MITIKPRDMDVCGGQCCILIVVHEGGGKARAIVEECEGNEASNRLQVDVEQGISHGHCDARGQGDDDIS